MHLPIMYEIRIVDEVGDGEADVTPDGRRIYDILMQDLVAPMTRPCALALVMGTRTVTRTELASAEEPGEARLLEAMTQIDAAAPSDAEKAAGGVSALRFPSFLDESTSTAALGFRIDAAKTVVDGALEVLPLPDGCTSFNTLRDEAAIVQAFVTFLQSDAALATAFAQKVQSLRAALERSTFFQRHVLLRSTLLLVYDDAARDELIELKIMNFGSCYGMPEGSAPLDHTQTWDGTSESNADGYLFGVQNLDRLLTMVCDKCVAGSSESAAAA